MKTGTLVRAATTFTLLLSQTKIVKGTIGKVMAPGQLPDSSNVQFLGRKGRVKCLDSSLVVLTVEETRALKRFVKD